jgi:hypothetical protein
MKMFPTMTAVLGDAAGSLPGIKDNDIIPLLLMLVVGIVLGMLLVFSVLMVHALRKERLATRRLPRHSEFLRGDRRSPTTMFSAPTRWLAIKSGNPQLVQAALGLANPKPCSWEEGLTAAHEHKLFISPPLGGWILVMGSNLPEPGDDVDKCFRFLLDLSRKLGHVQYFSINRAVNHHAWVQVEQGVVRRAYAWGGRTLWNQGRLTRAEIELALKCYAYGDGEDRIDFGRIDPAAVNTERVPLLASRWSLDPTAIDARMLKEHQGIAGKLSRSRAR